MMLEDILAFQSGTNLLESFSGMLAAELEDDARRLYVRMSFDIALVAAGSPAMRSAATRNVLIALLAPPLQRELRWRDVYRSVRRVLGGSTSRSRRAAGCDEVHDAAMRLRAFLNENADIMQVDYVTEALTAGA